MFSERKKTETRMSEDVIWSPRWVVHTQAGNMEVKTDKFTLM